jgi:hypothetical protein
MLLMGLYWGQTALSESGVILLGMVISTITLMGFGGGIIFGIVEPEAIPDEEMSTLASRSCLLMLIIGGLSLLVIVLWPYL